MKIFETNQNNSERIVRFILGALLLSVPLVIGFTRYTIALGSIGMVSIFNAVIGTCFIYRILGVTTCKIKG